MRLIKKLQTLVSSPYSLPIGILLLGILAYGIQIPWMGFYWDDWPWIWFSRVMGPEGMLRIDIEHRPLSGVVLYLGSLIFGENPLGWQLYNLAFRLLGCVSLAWMLKVLWPRYEEQINWTVLLFLVYPGFSQQFVAVNTSRHLFPLAAFFVSIGLMVMANKRRDRFWAISGASLGMSLITMFTSEYYYGLELIRPVILWIIIQGSEKDRKGRFSRVLKSWFPYLILLAGVFSWRLAISHNVNYQVAIFNVADPVEGTDQLQRVWAYLQGISAAGIAAWGKLLQLPDPELFGARFRLNYWVLVCLVSVGAFLYFMLHKSKPGQKRWGVDAMIIGGGLLITGPLPFWVAGLDLKLSFPFDRLTLPMMLGACLLLVGILETVVRNKIIKAAVVAVLVGYSVGYHYQNGVAFRRDWQHQTQFIQQLAWRIPGLEGGTALLANELPTTFSTDNSLTAPINWTYAPGFMGGDLPYYLFYTELRFGSHEFQLDKNLLSRDDYRFFPFRGSPEKVVVIFNNPPACLRVLSKDLHQDFPNLPPEIQAVLPYAITSQIQTEVETIPILPPSFSHSSQERDWCFYFERADLARQRADWEAVAEYGDAAFEVGFPDSTVKHLTEYEVFIDGYAHTDRWETALQLTLDAVENNQEMAPMLCNTWDRLMDDTSSSQEKTDALRVIDNKLGCEGY